MSAPQFFAVRARIQHGMSERGLTARALAAAAGISRSTFTRRMAAPGTFYLDELEQVANALNTTPSYLWRGDDWAPTA